MDGLWYVKRRNTYRLSLTERRAYTGGTLLCGSQGGGDKSSGLNENPFGCQYFMAIGKPFIWLLRANHSCRENGFACSCQRHSHLGVCKKTQTPADYNVQCLENVELLQFPYEQLQELYMLIPKLERFFRIIIQKGYVASEKRIIGSFSLPAKERHLRFREQYPQIEQRVPQYMIASYLGITKEFLSKIRSQLIFAPWDIKLHHCFPTKPELILCCFAWKAWLDRWTIKCFLSRTGVTNNRLLTRYSLFHLPTSIYPCFSHWITAIFHLPSSIFHSPLSITATIFLTLPDHWEIA